MNKQTNKHIGSNFDDFLAEENLLTEANSKQIQKTALDLLARREHSELELQNKLKIRGFELDHIEQVISQLKDAGYQSDTRFTEAYIKMRLQRGYGPIRISHELLERGIDNALITQHLSNDNEEWLSIAKQAREKHFGNPIPKDFPTQSKQKHFLQQRGFCIEHIQATFKP